MKDFQLNFKNYNMITNSFTQENGMLIEEGNLYRSAVGDLVKVTTIDTVINSLKVYNISESCRTWCRIDAAIKDNKFRQKC